MSFKQRKAKLIILKAEVRELLFKLRKAFKKKCDELMNSDLRIQSEERKTRSSRELKKYLTKEGKKFSRELWFTSGIAEKKPKKYAEAIDRDNRQGQRRSLQKRSIPPKFPPFRPSQTRFFVKGLAGRRVQPAIQWSIAPQRRVAIARVVKRGRLLKGLLGRREEGPLTCEGGFKGPIEPEVERIRKTGRKDRKSRKSV
ncbi:hypothetical protein MBM_03571 [Drepanopeziza brunnea f. sp. 'multigermtubi' MB_m1]|uniref:Uncharacterized protein n=1 Tax=Marssonina brunnea f. sp. multigermtubi (strain MB_m1) TaxID=1072389 RepID=K1XCT9_MARBU|nr:uncharacterized protein MBM_03571 [Drepanopeziza brunnea f. sp. 'multigermtubi' MB_m1]EKD18578.1 hypothetical protein MBM_03571 [Drepanopeziza brunnea f. sp. 'multigermtubi' MB_m1]